MYQEITVQLVSLIDIIILASVYFLKRKYNFVESKVYKLLLIFTIGSLVLDIFSMYLINTNIYGTFVTILFSKIYFISLFGWLMLFIFYAIINIISIKCNNFKELFSKSVLCKSLLIISSFLLFLCA